MILDINQYRYISISVLNEDAGQTKSYVDPASLFI